MVSLPALALPILLAALLVFVASSVIHMFLGYHAGDFGRLPDEDGVMAALRPYGVPPGEYIMPHAGTSAAMRDPAYRERAAAGPVAFVTFLPNGIRGMGAQLAQWFVYCAVVGLFAAYLASRALPPGAPFAEVLRFTGTMAFAGYGLALWQSSIWYRRKWSTTLKNTFDALVYALLTGAVFGWMWPG